MAEDANTLVLIEEDYITMMEVDRIRWENTKNPLYVWHTIGLCFVLGAIQIQVRTGKRPSSPPGTEPYPFPPWCLGYLGIVAARVEMLSNRKDFRLAPKPFGQTEPNLEAWGSFENTQATLEFGKAAEMTMNALEFQRNGWNAFERFTAMEKKELDAFSEEALRYEGKTPNQTMDILMDEANISDPRTMRRRISAARKARGE